MLFVGLQSSPAWLSPEALNVWFLCDCRSQQGEIDLEDKEDQFQPQLGNVAFASAHDGWAFRISQLAKQYADKLGCNASGLEQALWGDYAFQAKTKRIIKIKPDQTHKHKPLFVQVKSLFLSGNSIVTAASMSDACQASQLSPDGPVQRTMTLSNAACMSQEVLGRQFRNFFYDQSS